MKNIATLLVILAMTSSVEVAALGLGGICMKCGVCSYPACPFGRLG